MPRTRSKWKGASKRCAGTDGPHVLVATAATGSGRGRFGLGPLGPPASSGKPAGRLAPASMLACSRNADCWWPETKNRVPGAITATCKSTSHVISRWPTGTRGRAGAGRLAAPASMLASSRNAHCRWPETKNRVPGAITASCKAPPQGRWREVARGGAGAGGRDARCHEIYEFPLVAISSLHVNVCTTTYNNTRRRIRGILGLLLPACCPPAALTFSSSTSASPSRSCNENPAAGRPTSLPTNRRGSRFKGIGF